MKIIGIVGSRRRNGFFDYRAVEQAFQQLYEDGDCIVSGGCPKGGDRFAENIAAERKFTRIGPSDPYPAEGRVIKIHPALWDDNGRAAGFIRNTEIARDATHLIACVSKDRTGGTEDTIRKFLVKFGKAEANLILV